MNVVIDASVCAKWFFPEPETDYALGLLNASERGAIRFLAPDIIAAEMANLIWKKVLRMAVDDHHGMSSLARFHQIPITLQPTEELAAAALRLAIRFRHPVYDCIYIVLALRENCRFITADRRLFHTFSSAFSCVQPLNEWASASTT